MPADLECDEDESDHLSVLYEAEADAMRRLAYLIVGDLAVAEELAQEAFARVSVRMDDLDRPGAYLRTTLVNLARGHLRRRATERDTPWPRAPLELEPELDETWAALGELPERQRTALVLRFYRDLRLTDVAEAMECPVGTAKSLVHRGLRALKEVLEP